MDNSSSIKANFWIIGWFNELYIIINGLLKFYPEVRVKGLTNGSLTLTLIIITIDTIFYLFLNSWERVDEV